jgi:hypothetical protein
MSGVDQLTASERGLRRAYDLLKEQVRVWPKISPCTELNNHFFNLH